jgi:hypothetical protein
MNFQKIALRFLPHFTALVAFVIVANVFFSLVGDGYTLKQQDIQNVMGMAKEIQDYRLINDGAEPLWSGNMFAGMPAYQTTVIYSTNILRGIDKAMKLGMPPAIGTLFMCMLGFYIFALCLRINPWLAIAGGIAFGLGTINILYLGGGHTSKINAVSYMAPTIGALVMALRGRVWLGSALFALFFGLGLTANHFQMTYYMAFLVALIGITEVTKIILNKNWKHLFASFGLLSAAAIIGILPNIGNLLTTYEYSKHTTRGTSELTIKSDEKNAMAPDQDGLSDDYILNYNMAAGEPWSMIIANAKGGNSQVNITEYKDAMGQADKSVREQLKSFPAYWGGQGASAGAFYFGAAIMFLFFMALLFSKDHLRWPFLVMSVIAIALCMRDLHGINRFFIDSFPMYNKFRDSKMILVLIQFMAPALAIIWIQELIQNENAIPNRKPIFIGLGVGIVLLLGVTAKPSLTGELISPNEKNQFVELVNQYKGEAQTLSMIEDIQESLIKVRTAIFQKDAQRTVLLVIIATAIVVALMLGKLKKYPAIAVLSLLFIADIWSISHRYMNEEKELVAENKRDYKHYAKIDDMVFPFTPDATDLAILGAERKNIPDFDNKAQTLQAAMAAKVPYSDVKNKELIKTSSEFGALQLNTNFRVLLVTPGTMSESRTAYFHKSLGGYHAAKLKSYQELYDFYIDDEIARIQNALKSQSLPVIDSTLNTCKVINMLNTKYIKFNGSGNPFPNEQRALGNAWFVKNLRTTATADESMLAIAETDLSTTAIVKASDAQNLPVENSIDSTCTIQMTKYETNKISYTSQSNVSAVAVFSEIYYPEGWICRVDGNETPYFKTNHALRGALIPAGQHEIIWSFEPRSFNKSTTINTIGSTLLLLLLLLGVVMHLRSERNASLT